MEHATLQKSYFYGDNLKNFELLVSCVCRDLLPPVHLSLSILAGLVLSCVWTLLCEAHIQYIAFTDTHSPTDGYGAAEGVCVGLCVCVWGTWFREFL